MPTHLGALVKRLRMEHHLSQRALGARADRTNPSIVQLEMDQRGNPTVLIAVGLAAALHVPVMKLIECAIKDPASQANQGGAPRLGQGAGGSNLLGGSSEKEQAKFLVHGSLSGMGIGYGGVAVCLEAG